MDGILNIYKERGFTSHDVVAKLRGICKTRRIGHTGTLDPDAEGVLPVCIGRATKLCERLTDKQKEYRAVMRLGVVTDTQDMSGAVLEEHSVENTAEDVIRVINSFVGEYDQIPPMYSALKVNGKKLYELARAGQVVEREARRIAIHYINIEEIHLPMVTMTVACSKGTYIRTLCHDIGQKLGCGAAMESLLRTQSGQFQLDDSLRLSQVQQIVEEGRLGEILLPPDQLFVQYQSAVVKEAGEKLLFNGNPMPIEFLEAEKSVDEFADGDGLRIYDRTGTFIGFYIYEKKRQTFKPEILFLGKE